MINLKTYFLQVYLAYSFLRLHSQVDKGVHGGLMPSGNKLSPAPMYARSVSPHGVTWSPCVHIDFSFLCKWTKLIIVSLLRSLIPCRLCYQYTTKPFIAVDAEAIISLCWNEMYSDLSAEMVCHNESTRRFNGGIINYFALIIHY